MPSQSPFCETRIQGLIPLNCWLIISASELICIQEYFLSSQIFWPCFINVDNKFFVDQFLQESASVNIHYMIRESLRSTRRPWWSSTYKQILALLSKIFWSRCRCCLLKASRILYAGDILWRLDSLEAQPSSWVIICAFW